jgi:hypothetical protein
MTANAGCFPELLGFDGIAEILLGLDAVVCTEETAYYGQVEGPRVFLGRMLPHPNGADACHAWVWPDGLMVVSKDVWGLIC